MEELRRVLERLGQAAHGEAHDFAKLLQDLLATDFEKTFSLVKTQKLVLKRRSSKWISQLEKHMGEWLVRAPLKGKQKAHISRHLAVCKAIQELLEIIDEQSSSLRIWQASTRDLLYSLFASVEERRFEQESRAPERNSQDDALDALKGADLVRMELRTYCDQVVRIVNQISVVGSGKTGSIRPSSSDIKEAIGMAVLADTVIHILDCYTYKNFRVSVDGKHLTMYGLHSPVEYASKWSSLRATSSEMLQGHEFTQMLQKLENFARTLECEPVTFGRFLESAAGRQILEASGRIRDWYSQMLRGEVDDEIDLDLTLRTRSGASRADELLDYWAFLFQLAICARMWCRILRNEGVAVVPSSQLVSLFCLCSGAGDKESERLLSQFSLDPRERNQDPFFRPLIRLDREEYLIAATFIETSRFSRNIFTIAIREGNVDFSAKGLKPLKGLYQKFLSAGFSALLNFPIKLSGKLVTDVDIAAAKDGFLFIGQTKVLIRPDTPYDKWKVLENLRKAADQLTASLQHISVLRDRLGLIEGEFLVVPFLLTNIWNFTGSTINGFKVVDFSYLSMLLTGGEISKILFKPVPRREIFKLIRGKYPTGIELSERLQKPLHEAMFERPKLEMRSFVVGDWTVTVPIDTGKLPRGMQSTWLDSPGSANGRC